jgi:hypothetical protein
MPAQFMAHVLAACLFFAPCRHNNQAFFPDNGLHPHADSEARLLTLENSRGAQNSQLNL